MRKFWILLFAVVPIAVVWLYFYSAGFEGEGLWLPKNVSPIGEEIDHLFWLIMWITGVTFFGVYSLFIYFLWKYGGSEKPGKSIYTHGNHRLEMIWTVTPAAILVFIALYQFGTWERAKFVSNSPETPIVARVLGGQFEWRVRYTAHDNPVTSADLLAADDVDALLWRGEELEMVNELHAVKGQPVMLTIRSRDVIHSFNIPQLRVKQDLMPGMDKQLMWFQADEAGTYEIACTELCGWGHYKMRGKFVVHETAEEYQSWYEGALAAQRADQVEMN